MVSQEPISRYSLQSPDEKIGRIFVSIGAIIHYFLSKNLCVKMFEKQIALVYGHSLLNCTIQLDVLMQIREVEIENKF